MASATNSADPRHAELLAKSLKLENCKFMVTPGVKLPFDNNSGPDEDDQDTEEDTQMVNKMATKARLRPIRVNLDADIVNVPMQSEVYGMHPRNFVFD